MERFLALDGLRGLATLLVFLNHVPSGQFYNHLSPFWRFLANLPFSYGKIAVSLLFLLSGFLIYYLNSSVNNPFTFLKKRYQRIFPLFITLNLIMGVFRQTGYKNPFIVVATVTIIPLLIHLIYKKIRLLNSDKLNSCLFWSFVALQLTTMFYYLLILGRHPAADFARQPFWQKELTIFLVNITLALPLGDYIPFLDGVYWSLVTEILFYWLYPFLLLPVIQGVKKQGLARQLLFLCSLIFFFFGLHLVLQRILVLSMLQINLFIYFVSGIILADLVKNLKGKLIITNPVKTWSLISFLVYVVLMRSTSSNTPLFFKPLLVIIWSFPFIFFLLVSVLDNQNSLYRFLTNRFWLFLGSISYSFYLCHTLVVNTFKQFFFPKDLLSNLFFIFFALLCSLLLAYYLYFLIEKLYYSKNKSGAVPSLPSNISPRHSSPHVVWLAIGIYFLLLLLGYQGRFNLSSLEEPIIVTSLPKIIKITNTQPLTFSFTGKYTNLGAVVFDLYAPNSLPDSKGEMAFSLLRAQKLKPFSQTRNYLFAVNPRRTFPFGFLPIGETAQNNLVGELALVNSSKNEELMVYNQPYLFKAIYHLNKKDLFTNPLLFSSWIQNKLDNLFENSEFKISFLLVLPLILVSLGLNKAEFDKKKE